MKKYYVAVYINLTIQIIHSELEKDELAIVWKVNDIYGPFKDRTKAIEHIVDILQQREKDKNEN